MVLLKDIESSGIKIGIVFDLFVYKIHGDSVEAFFCGTEILISGF